MGQFVQKRVDLRRAPAFTLLALLLGVSCGGDDDSVAVPSSPVCAAGAVACDGDAIITCLAGGTGWSAPQACEAGQQCALGVCSADGVEIVTASLPAGTVGVAYDLVLQASREGCSWTLGQGALPDGIGLSTAGELSGTPAAAGEFDLSVVADCGAGDTAERSYVLTVLPPGFVITTTSLPAGLEGFDYTFGLEAAGGTEPYAWMVADGELPTGMYLTANGELLGAPSEIGDFPLLIKAFDNAPSPSVASQQLNLTIGIAPLEIYGTQEFDLLVGKLVVLDTITIVPGFPLPYTTPLLARGGLSPYDWSEVELPGLLTALIPTSGIPDGLTLDADGTLHGSVTSTDQVITVGVPLSTVQVTGFFFAARVADSQSPAETKDAVFVMPTIPIGG